MYILWMSLFMFMMPYVHSQCSLSLNPSSPSVFCNNDSVLLCAVASASDIDQSQNVYNGGTSARTLAGYSIFQSFTAGVTGTLTQIDIGFFNFINGSGTLKVYQGAGTTGTVLSSQTVSVFCAAGNCLLPFPVNIPITAGAVYTFHFLPGAGIPDPYGVQVQVPGTYPGGYFGLIDPSGTYNTGFDMVFKTHVKNTVTYLWSTGSTDSCVFVKSVGLYSVTISSSPIVCNKSASVNVTGSGVPPDANAGADKTIDCTSPSVQLSGSSTSPGVSYSWSGPGILSGGNTAIPTVNAAGTYTLTVTQTATGCTNTDQATVTSTTAPPNANAGADKTIDCTSPSVQLSGSSTSPGVSYSWSGPGILSGGNTAIPTVNAAGTYTLTVTQPGTGCISSDIVEVSNKIAQLSLMANVQGNICTGDTSGAIDISLLSGTAPFNFSWSNGSTSEDLTHLAKGSYRVRIRDAGNCVKDTVFNVIDYGVTVTADYDTTLEPGQSLQLRGGVTGMAGIRSVLWQPESYLSCSSCMDPVAAPLNDMDYVFSATDSNGCIASDTIHIKLAEKREWYFPAAFTPNYDGHNDNFTALGNNDIVAGFEMKVYNRWGEQLAVCTDIQTGWDGNYKGQPADADTYGYLARITFKDNSVRNYKGMVALLR